MKDSRPILLVDDDNTDVLLFERMLTRLDIASPVVHSLDGVEALEYLTNSSNKKPWIVLTDLNTPKMNGFEFLQAVKSHEELKRTIIVVLSGSSADTDVDECFRLGAAGYITKPADYEKLRDMIQTIHAYWSLSEVPPEV
jgi:CheY-like chemotaxis protein